MSELLTNSAVATSTSGTIGDFNWGPHYHPEPYEHDFHQAASPYGDTLYCRKCGDTQRLRQRTKEA